METPYFDVLTFEFDNISEVKSVFGLYDQQKLWSFEMEFVKWPKEGAEGEASRQVSFHFGN